MRNLTFRSLKAPVWLGLLLLMLAACQPNNTPTITPAPPTLTATPPGGLSITVTPASGSSLPAGSSTSFVLSLQYPSDKVPQSVAWETQNSPTGIQAQLVGQTSPWQRRLLITTDSTLAAGSYTLDVVANVEPSQPVRTAITVTVTDCVQTESSASTTTGINSNMVALITAGKPAVEHGLLIPLQVCGSAQHLRVTLKQAQAEDGSTMTTPPAFYLFLSEVWPAPNHITAHGLPESINVQVPDITQTNSGSVLDVDVTPGLYLLIFEHDRYGATLTPPTRVSFVTYSLAIQ